MTDSTASILDVDLTRLPVGEAIVALRAVGSTLFQALLTGATIPSIRPFLVNQPDLFRLLDVRSFGSDSIDVATKRWLENASDRSSWLNSAGSEINHALGVARAASIPTLLWPLIGNVAWLTSDLESRVNNWLADYLRPRVLFVSGELPRYSLSPNLVWLLVAVGAEAALHDAPKTMGPPVPGTKAGSTSSQTTTPFDRLRRFWSTAEPKPTTDPTDALAPALSNLRSVGLRMFQYPDWADYWDLWLASLIYRKWYTRINDYDLQRTLTAASNRLEALEKADGEISVEVDKTRTGIDAGQIRKPNWLGPFWTTSS